MEENLLEFFSVLMITYYLHKIFSFRKSWHVWGGFRLLEPLTTHPKYIFKGGWKYVGYGIQHTQVFDGKFLQCFGYPMLKYLNFKNSKMAHFCLGGSRFQPFNLCGWKKSACCCHLIPAMLWKVFQPSSVDTLSNIYWQNVSFGIGILDGACTLTLYSSN